MTSRKRSRPLAAAERIAAWSSADAIPCRLAAGTTKSRLTSAERPAAGGCRRITCPATGMSSVAATHAWRAPDGWSHRAGSAGQFTG